MTSLKIQQHQSSSDEPINEEKPITLFGIDFAAEDINQSVMRLSKALDSQRKSSLYFVNAHCFNISCDNLRYRRALHNADFIFPDGIGAEWGSTVMKNRKPHNLNGTDLFPHLCKLFSAKQQKIFLLGAQPGTAEKVSNWIQSNFPESIICGTHHGHFSESESEQIISTINASGADIVFVAMGVPRQEIWIDTHRAGINSKLLIAVGGLFEFYSDNIPRAPQWVRGYRLEWIWRLSQEPNRLWKRYIIGSIAFVLRILREYKVATQCKREVTSRYHRYHRIRTVLRTWWVKRAFRIRLVYQKFSKRLFDIFVSSTLLLLLLPFLPLLALAIKLESKGPLFFKQHRVGLDGELFEMLKFRSMQANAESKLQELMHLNEKKGGVMFKITNDPRITRVGKFIRKYSIDELPQLWNVFVGEMSIVGPRPALPNEVSQYLLYQRGRLNIKPGLTSSWVIEGRNHLTFEQQAELDIDYFYRHSMWSDFKLLLQTIPIIISGRGAS